MQKNILYSDLIPDIKRFFIKQCDYAINSGIKKSNIIIDPGIGFGKSFDHNFTLLKRLEDFKDLDFPILIGPSRKAFIGDVLNLPSNERVEGTIATIVAGILNGANIIRVHDVKETYQALEVYKKYGKYLPKEEDRTSLTVDAFSKKSDDGAKLACGDRLNYTQE